MNKKNYLRFDNLGCGEPGLISDFYDESDPARFVCARLEEKSNEKYFMISTPSGAGSSLFRETFENGQAVTKDGENV